MELPATQKVTCRICGSDAAHSLGEVEYLRGFRWMVYDCAACGCRFTKHDETVHENLHLAGAISYYGDYRRLADGCRACFGRKDAEGLRELLSVSPKYKFVIDQLSPLPRNSRLLEVGCSRGYLTSWFILEGRDILGVDVSVEAIQSARKDFGEHFAMADAPEVKTRAPYDAIFHAGMIGCVRDPVGLTRQLLSLLKPGGMLCFNAPNRDACRRKGQLWLDSAPPPDLVTLFPPGFWARQFDAEAAVREDVLMHGDDPSCGIRLRNLLGPVWRPPVPADRFEPGAARDHASGMREWVIRAIARLARVTGLSALAKPWPTDFGLHVTMRVKGGANAC